MTRADLQPLREVYKLLRADTESAGLGQANWPGWFEWRFDDPDNWDGRTFLKSNYGPKMLALWNAFQSAGWRPEPFDWQAWEKTQDRLFERGTTGLFDLAGLTRLLVVIERRERYCEGFWVDCLVSSVFMKIVMSWLTQVTYPSDDPGLAPKLGTC